jgi:hypothetical protein
VEIAREVPGSWTLVSEEAKPVEAGKVEQLCAQIAAVQVMTFLPEDTVPDALGLNAPIYTLQVTTGENQQHEILVGKRIPTGNGYYVQVNDQTPIVIDQNNVDTIVSLMNALLVSEPTGTPAP